MEIIDIKTRKSLPKFLNKNNLCGVGAEIGVSTGRFSTYLLKHWNGTLLYSIDPWKSKNKAVKYVEAKNQLQQYEDRSIILKMTSLEASKTIKDNSLDFCYIDANHTYDFVLQDCNLWWLKIKSGGILCGHDYDYGKECHWRKSRAFPHPGVKLAVDEFINENKLDLYYDTRLTSTLSWYTIKNA